MTLLFSFIAAVVSLLCVEYCTAYFVHIDAHAEECFFDKVTSGTKMSLMFEVAEGGFLDIDVKVSASLLRCVEQTPTPTPPHLLLPVALYKQYWIYGFIFALWLPVGVGKGTDS